MPLSLINHAPISRKALSIFQEQFVGSFGNIGINTKAKRCNISQNSFLAAAGLLEAVQSLGQQGQTGTCSARAGRISFLHATGARGCTGASPRGCSSTLASRFTSSVSSPSVRMKSPLPGQWGIEVPAVWWHWQTLPPAEHTPELGTFGEHSGCQHTSRGSQIDLAVCDSNPSTLVKVFTQAKLSWTLGVKATVTELLISTCLT